jgi:hypothetical protein
MPYPNIVMEKYETGNAHLYSLVSLLKGRTEVYVRFEVFTAVTMKNGVFWDVVPCGSCKNRSVRRLIVTASVVLSSPILVTLMKETLSSSETSVLT